MKEKLTIPAGADNVPFFGISKNLRTVSAQQLFIACSNLSPVVGVARESLENDLLSTKVLAKGLVVAQDKKRAPNRVPIMRQQVCRVLTFHRVSCFGPSISSCGFYVAIDKD